MKLSWKWVYGLLLLQCLLWFTLAAFMGYCPLVVELITFVSAILVFGRVLFILSSRKMVLDRTLARSRFSTVYYVAMTIVAVPVLLWGIIWIGNLMGEDTLIPEELAYCEEMFYDCSESDSITLDANQSSHVKEYQLQRQKEKNGRKKSPDIMTGIIYHFSDAGNQPMATTHQGRIWASIIGFLGVVLLSGVLVSTLTNHLDRRADAWKGGTCRYDPRGGRMPIVGSRMRKKKKNYRKTFGKYVVIYGAHPSISGLCKQILKGDIDNIFILTGGDVEILRNTLRSAGVDMNRIVIYLGSHTDLRTVEELYPRFAEEIHILGEGEGNPQYDVQNMTCLSHVASLMDGGPKTDELVKCYIQFEYQTAFAALQSSSSIGIACNSLEIIPYSYYENWSRRVLIDDVCPEMLSDDCEKRYALYTSNRGKKAGEDLHYHYLPIDGGGISFESSAHVHLVIVGMSKMGVAMAIEAAQIAHYPNFVRDSSLRTRISFIDLDADSEKNFFMGRFKSMFELAKWRYVTEDEALDDNAAWHCPKDDYLDIEWEFIKGGCDSPKIQEYLVKCAAKAVHGDDSPGEKLSLAICIPEEHAALATALYLPREVYDKALQILVYQKNGAAMGDLVSANSILFPECAPTKYFDCTRYYKLHSFGMMSDSVMASGKKRDDEVDLLRRIARIYDNIDKTRTIEELTAACDEDRGLAQKLEWPSMEIWKQWSNAYNAAALDSKRRSLGEYSSRAFASIRHLTVFDPTTYSIMWPRPSAVGPWDTDEQGHVVGYALRDLFNEIPEDFPKNLLPDLERLRYMSILEHNRWNVEKLLMGYRPLTLEEKTDRNKKVECSYSKRGSVKYAAFLKDSAQRAHQCICAFSDLYAVDAGTIDYDVAFTLMLPYLWERKDQKNLVE